MKLLAIERTNRFKRDLKRIIKRGKNPEKIKKVILKLISQEALPKYMHDHALYGNYKNTRECHIEPDWLLVYTVIKDVIRLERTGSHADLF